MSSNQNKILRLVKRLYPKGRAFEIKKGSNRDRYESAVSIIEAKAVNDVTGILNQILPDNDQFDDEAADRMEQFLGLIDGSGNTISERKAAIRRAYNHPGTVLARQSWDYIQDSLQLAGFDVYVHDNKTGENIFDVLQPYSNVAQQGQAQQGDFQQGTIYSVNSGLFTVVQQSFQQGTQQQGTLLYKDKVVNHIDEIKDLYFNFNGNYRRVSYIGGQNLGTFANVPLARKDEFRQLIMKLKPSTRVIFLLINYT